MILQPPPQLRAVPVDDEYLAAYVFNRLDRQLLPWGGLLARGFRLDTEVPTTKTADEVQRWSAHSVLHRAVPVGSVRFQHFFNCGFDFSFGRTHFNIPHCSAIAFAIPRYVLDLSFHL